MKNLNKGFYKDLDINFEEALKMSSKDFNHNELIFMLQNGNIPEKQIAALKLSSIDNDDDASVLISNLTGCDGKIREAVALKIKELLFANPNLYTKFNYPEIFANATIDINANICRTVIDCLDILKQDKNFAQNYMNKILEFINQVFLELDKFIFKDKKYLINKQLFKLYWALEALKNFVNIIDQDILYSILSRTANEREYTIREKTAQIIVNLDHEIYNNLKKMLKNDENYYVRIVFQ